MASPRGDAEQRPLALLVCGPGLSHMNAMISLSKALLHVDFRVTLVFFARVHAAHRARLQALPAHVPLEVLPDGLPSGPPSHADLFVTSPQMPRSLAALVLRLRSQGTPPTCLVAEAFMSWTQDVADQLALPRVGFWGSNATSFLMVLAFPELLRRGYIGDQSPLMTCDSSATLDFIDGLPQLPISELPKEVMCVPDAITHPIMQACLLMAEKAKAAERLLIHSLEDLEESEFEALRGMGIPAYGIGPLLHHTLDREEQRDDTSSESVVWLEKQPASSVLYVSFGSIVVISKEEIVELAHGLESSGVPFLWVIRKDHVLGDEGLLSLLPTGFESCLKSRGLIVPWAPQLAVLAHPAVGGFLTHCGWNSTLESMWMAKPMLSMPRGADQMSNARLLSKRWGVGLKLETSKTGKIEGHKVAQGINFLMHEKEGLLFDHKVEELSKLVRKATQKDGQSYSNLLRFARDMKAIVAKQETHSQPK